MFVYDFQFKIVELDRDPDIKLWFNKTDCVHVTKGILEGFQQDCDIFIFLELKYQTKRRDSLKNQDYKYSNQNV